MSESRTELIAWLNDLLKLNYTKVEQCGTGNSWKKIIRNNIKVLKYNVLYLYNVFFSFLFFLIK